MTVKLYTDGSCVNNPGVGGWACLLECKGRERELSGAEPSATNNRMELTAVIRGLEYLSSPRSVEVMTDSQYIRNAFSQKWIERWEKNGWKKSNKRPVANIDLWKRLLKQIDRHISVNFNWIPGHSGNKMHDRVDKLARETAYKKALIDCIKQYP